MGAALLAGSNLYPNVKKVCPNCAQIPISNKAIQLFKLGDIHAAYANGKLNGIDNKVNSKKDEVIRDVLKNINEKKENIVAIIDGANDIGLFKISGLKISFNGAKLINEKSDFLIKKKDLGEIIPIIREAFAL